MDQYIAKLGSALKFAMMSALFVGAIAFTSPAKAEPREVTPVVNLKPVAEVSYYVRYYRPYYRSYYRPYYYRPYYRPYYYYRWRF